MGSVDFNRIGNDPALIRKMEEFRRTIAGLGSVVESEVGLSLSQMSSAIDEMRQAYQEIWNMGGKNIGEAQASFNRLSELWGNYLNEFAAFEQNKEAVRLQYDAQIARASTNDEKESLSKSKESELENLSTEQLLSSINWVELLSSFGNQIADTLARTSNHLNELVRTSGKNLSSAGSQLTPVAMNLNSEGNDSFEAMGTQAGKYRQALEAVKKAQKDLNVIQQGGQVIAGTYLNESGKICTVLLSQKQAEENLTNAQKRRSEAVTELSNSVQSIGKSGKVLVEAGKSVNSALTNVGVEVPTAVSGALDGVGTVMDSMADINFTNPVSIIKGAAGALSGVAKIVGSVFKLGADYSEYDELKQRYEGLIQIWDKLLSKKRAYINESYGAEATKAGEEALKILNNEKEINKILAEARLSSGKSAGSHSLDYRMWQGSYKWEGTNWQDVSKEVEQGLRKKGLGSVQFNGMGDMLNMTGEQLEWIKENYSGLWTKMDGDFRNSLENIIQYGETEKQILESVKKQITGISVDDFSNSYLNMLNNLDSTNEDFANSLENYLKKAIFQSLVANKYKDKIQNLYNAWAQVGEDGYKKEDVERLREMQQQLTDEMLAEREQQMEIFGWESKDKGTGTSQRSTSGGMSSMSQDTADELNGRFSSFQLSNEEIRNTANLIYFNLVSMKGTTDNSNGILSELKNLHIMSITRLDDINKNTKQLYEMNQRLGNIEKNTSNL